MMFALSKIVWFFAQPSNVLIFLTFLFSVFFIFRWRKLYTFFSVLLCFWIVCLGFLPVGMVLLYPLENRFKPKDIADISIAPVGIIVLGGAVEFGLTESRRTYTLSNSGERVLEGILLAKRFPNAKVIVNDDETMFYMNEVGIAKERIVLEGESRNTFENAKYTRELFPGNTDGSWLLVTSAGHMPRAVGSFCKMGFDIIPWPVDYRTPASVSWRLLRYEFPEKLEVLDLATKEWLGLVAYRLAGRTNALFPGSGASRGAAEVIDKSVCSPRNG
jgi:uncharacterized SAM-binding protein YcdF (DUF218 family)